MIEHFPFGMPRVPTSKVVLREPSGNIVLVAGKSGRHNLVGGEIEPGETALDALWREMEEELGLSAQYVRNVRSIGRFMQPVVPIGRDPYKAAWRVHTGDLIAPVQEMIPGNEIQHAVAWSAEKILSPPPDKVVSRLAQRAVRMSIR